MKKKKKNGEVNDKGEEREVIRRLGEMLIKRRRRSDNKKGN